MKDLLLTSSVHLYNGTTWLKEKVTSFAKNQDGVTAIEYAVIAVAVSGVLLTAFGDEKGSGLVGTLTAKFTKMVDNLKGTTGASTGS